MATSLALLTGAGWANAQAPKWESGAPAKTQWATFSPAPPASEAAAKPNTFPPLAPPAVEPAAPIGTRVILFQKPAELPAEVKPVDPKMIEPKAMDPKVIEPKMIDPKSTGAASPKLNAGEPLQEDVFRMAGDDELQGKPSVVLDLVRKSKPTPAPPPRIPYVSRAGTAAPMRLLLEPGYVVHRRLYFEEKNAERYGWDAGFAQPLISLAYFYKDVLLYPSKLGSNMRERYETNAGKYLPGSPVPYYLYPPEITLVGAALGAAAIVGTVFLLQ